MQEKNLNIEKVKEISKLKQEPEWMTEFRVNAYNTFVNTPNPIFGPELNIDFSGNTILEPCVGGGHMANGILNYLSDDVNNVKLIGTDIRNRGYENDTWELYCGPEYDFVSEDYPYDDVDWIIMNPPYSVIEPFTIRALEIAKKGIIMLGRLQFLEGEGRFENILKFNPPTDVYIYVDRIQCWKDGLKPEGSSA